MQRDVGSEGGKKKERINCQVGGSSLCISERVHVCYRDGLRTK